MKQACTFEVRVQDVTQKPPLRLKRQPALPLLQPHGSAARLRRVRGVRHGYNSVRVIPLLLRSVAFERAESESEITLKIVDSKWAMRGGTCQLKFSSQSGKGGRF